MFPQVAYLPTAGVCLDCAAVAPAAAAAAAAF